jgi:hypothetical protein
MKEDAPAASETSKTATPRTVTSPTPDSEPEHPIAREISEGSEGGTLIGGSSGVATAVGTVSDPNRGKGKGKASVLPASAGPAAPPPAKDEPKEDKQSNLVGKINNLVSTDLGNITEGEYFVPGGLWKAESLWCA